jgi:hypothetical protein
MTSLTTSMSCARALPCLAMLASTVASTVAVAAPAVLEIKVSPATADPVWNAFDDDDKTRYCFQSKEEWETLQLGLSAMTRIDEVTFVGLSGMKGADASSRTTRFPGVKADANGTIRIKIGENLDELSFRLVPAKGAKEMCIGGVVLSTGGMPTPLFWGLDKTALTAFESYVADVLTAFDGCDKAALSRLKGPARWEWTGGNYPIEKIAGGAKLLKYCKLARGADKLPSAEEVSARARSEGAGRVGVDFDKLGGHARWVLLWKGDRWTLDLVKAEQR